MNRPEDFIAWTISEFRADHGKVGGPFADAPLLLLHTRGARTGRERVNPMMYLADGGRYLVFASKAGSDRNPDWYHNLLAYPASSIEVGGEHIEVDAAPNCVAQNVTACSHSRPAAIRDSPDTNAKPNG